MFLKEASFSSKSVRPSTNPVWPGFDSRIRRHMWVEFVVGSSPCSEGFSLGSPIFLPPQKPTFQIPIRFGNESHKFVSFAVNTERSYKRQGHAPLKHFVGLLCNGGKPE